MYHMCLVCTVVKMCLVFYYDCNKISVPRSGCLTFSVHQCIIHRLIIVPDYHSFSTLLIMFDVGKRIDFKFLRT